MRNHFILIVSGLLHLAGVITAQTLVKENRIWSNSMYGTELEEFWQNSYWIKFEGDSIIKDTVYKVIYKSNDEFHENWYWYGVIREDSSEKVFIYRNNKEQLLYDFNLSKGDSIIDYYGMVFYVTKVDSILFENFKDPLKQIHLSCFKNDDPTAYNSWIEGIGSLGGVLMGTQDICIVGAVYQLICFYENDTLKYHNSFVNTCFPIGFDNGLIKISKPEKFIQIVNNNENVTFTFNNIKPLNGKLHIYDLTGKCLEFYKIECINELNISKNKLCQGLYIYYYQSNDHFEAGKFIIE